MMRAKLMLWGAAAAIALSSTAALASVVVVKSLGPSSKAYPPGKTLPETRQDHPSGRRRRHRARSEQRARRCAVRAISTPSRWRWPRPPAKRGRFGALRAAEVAHNPSIWDIDVTPERQDVRHQRIASSQLWRPDSEAEP